MKILGDEENTFNKQENDFLIASYLPANEVHILGGRSGAGKTHLLFQILHRYRGDFDPILYVTGDRPASEVTRLFQKLEIEPWEVVGLIDDDAQHLSMDQILFEVDNHQRPFRWLDKRITAMSTKPKLVVLDPGQRFIPCKNLNWQSSAASGLAAVMTWAVKQSITVILVWHVNKTATKDLNDVFDRFTGSHGCQSPRYIPHPVTRVIPPLWESSSSRLSLVLLVLVGKTFPNQLPPGKFESPSGSSASAVLVARFATD